MFLYHGTTVKRAQSIFSEGVIKCNVERHYTKEKSGNGYTEQGYIYLALEPTFSIYFANCCDHEDKSQGLVIFRIEMDETCLQPDYDEIRIQPMHDFVREKYKDDLDYSMHGLKTCRYDRDISLDEKVSYITIDITQNILGLIGRVGYNFQDTKEHYSEEQKNFLDSIVWKSCSECL